MYNKILEKYNDIQNLNFANSLLNWDQSTYITKNGVAARAEIIETLAKLSHELFTSDEYYDTLNNFLSASDFKNLSDLKKREILKIKSEVERAKKIPAKLNAELAKITATAMSSWEYAKAENDDEEFLPLLKEIFNLKKEVCAAVGYDKNPYNALLDEYDKGLKFEYIEPLFESLESEFISILQKIKNSDKSVDDSFLFKKYFYQEQWDFGLGILKKMGIDFDSFRQDSSAHPFTTTLGRGDIRITTDCNETNFKKGFFSTVHEGGHAIYEISVSSKFETSPFAILESLSLHESQSRFYENIMARSLPFWRHFFPELKNIFNDQLKDVNLEDFYYAINKVENSPIRIEADELTYNLHIILRTQLENLIINDKVDVFSINDVWNEKTKKFFGFYPDSKSQGYLQDIHWSCGLIGYFPTYTLGNLISAQLYHFLQKDIGALNEINEDRFKQIHNWFVEKMYNFGSQFTSVELVKNMTGEGINPSYFIDYLKNKFLNIY